MALKTVFVIEPDEYHRDIIHTALDHHGYQVVEVDGRELANMPAERELPDLLVVAHAGPAQNREILAWLRRTADTAGIPIICVSEDVRPWHMDEAIEAGCAVVCLKPLDSADFVAQVHELIGPGARVPDA